MLTGKETIFFFQNFNCKRRLRNKTPEGNEEREEEREAIKENFHLVRDDDDEGLDNWGIMMPMTSGWVGLGWVGVCVTTNGCF